MADDAFKVESDKTNASLTIVSVAGEERIFKLTGLAHEITGVKVAQKKGKQTVSPKLAKREEKTWHKLLDERQHGNRKLTHCFDEGDCRGRYRQNREQQGPGVNQKKGKHVDVSQPSETASTVLAIVGGDADESMDMVRPEAEEAQNTLTAEMLSGSLFDDHADQHNQLPDEFVVSIELKEQKQTEDLAGMQAHRHELQILLPRSSDEYQTKFRDERNEITKTMKVLSIIQHEGELEEESWNEQQLRKELSMVAQDDDAEHGDGNSRQEAYQEDDDLKLRNESIQEYKELQEQIQAYFSSTAEILDQKFKQKLDRMAKDAYRETQRYIANLQSIFNFLAEKLQISLNHDMLDGSDWEYRTANTLHVTGEQFEKFHAEGEAEV